MTTPLNVWSAMPGANLREFPRNDPAEIEIYGYCDCLSYEAGQTVRLFVHTTAPRFDLTVVCDSGDGEVVLNLADVAGTIQRTAKDAYASGCDWSETVSFQVDAAWPSGVYIISLIADCPSGGRVEREAGFVVRPRVAAGRERMLMILATGTYVAYNDWGGANAYRRSDGKHASDELAPRLSLHRPWARGFLRLPTNAPRHADVPDLPPFGQPRHPYYEWALSNGYSRHYSDAGWAYYERPFTQWARQNGFVLDFITQHDLPRCQDLLSGYSSAVIVGHDEYWTWEMRDAIDLFVGAGGRLARFGANFIWQTRMEHDQNVQVCYKVAADDPAYHGDNKARTTTYWDAEFIGRPAASTMGLSGLGGIYVRFGAASPRASGGYTVFRPDHWVFRDTDLRYGDQFGQEPSRILAFEVDGLEYTFRGGQPYPTYVDGAPAGLQILAMAPAARGERTNSNGLFNAPLEMATEILQQAPAFYEIPNVEFGAAMMVIFGSGKGGVFNSGCCNWVSGLICSDPFVEQITRNVLNACLRGDLEF